MSIQQSINQMLTIAAGGIGLYAHSPEGQKQAEIKKLEKDYQKTEENIEEWSEPVKEEETNIAEFNAKLQRERSQRLYQLDPSTERASQLKQDITADPSWAFEDPTAEVKALTSLTKRVGDIENRITEFEKRKTLLKKYRNKGGR